MRQRRRRPAAWPVAPVALALVGVMTACMLFPPTITTTSLPDGTVGRRYSVVLRASGGRPPYTPPRYGRGPYVWSAEGLPAGLRVSGDRIVGTPTRAGTATVTITLTRRRGGSVSRSMPLRIVGPDDPGDSLLRITDGNGPTYEPSVSADGGYVAYFSAASDLVAGDGNGMEDVFVRERATGTTVRVTDGNTPSAGPSASGDGRYVAFHSWASNLVPGEYRGNSEVFLWDRSTGTTTRVTSGNRNSWHPSVSRDGRYVTFESEASDLVPGDVGDHSDVFVWDRVSSTITRLTAGNGPSFSTTASADGRFVTYLSYASDLVPGDDNGVWDIFVWDRSTGTTSRITDGDGGSEDPMVSGDGRFVAYCSWATDLVPGDTNGQQDVFVWDGGTGSTTRVTDGNGSSCDPSISDDGRYVAFFSFASDLAPGDTNAAGDAFLWDRSSGATTLLVQGDAYSDFPSMTADGSAIAFTSQASNLVPDDTNGMLDAFVWTRGG